MIDGNKLILWLNDVWYASFKYEESPTSIAIKEVMKAVEEYVSGHDTEVVRCKDCEYYNIPTQYRYTNSKLCCRSALQKVEENDFCSWAKMKGGAE